MTTCLDTVTGLFYDRLDQLGRFTEVSSEEMPPGYRQLLAHDEHMTVTVERYHGGPVDVRVVRRIVDGQHYSREILLTRRRDSRVVQYGIMRVNFAHLQRQVRRQIEAEQTPLGRVLIENDVHRRVRLGSLWRVEAGPSLVRLMELASPEATFGRTASIDCHGEPAIELLEIVAPLIK